MQASLGEIADVESPRALNDEQRKAVAMFARNTKQLREPIAAGLVGL